MVGQTPTKRKLKSSTCPTRLGSKRRHSIWCWSLDLIVIVIYKNYFWKIFWHHGIFLGTPQKYTFLATLVLFPKSWLKNVSLVAVLVIPRVSAKSSHLRIRVCYQVGRRCSSNELFIYKFELAVILFTSSVVHICDVITTNNNTCFQLTTLPRTETWNKTVVRSLSFSLNKTNPLSRATLVLPLIFIYPLPSQYSPESGTRYLMKFTNIAVFVNNTVGNPLVR